MTAHLHVGTNFSDTTHSQHTITLLAAHYKLPSQMANKLVNWKVYLVYSFEIQTKLTQAMQGYENTITVSGHTFTISSQNGPNSQILFTDPRNSVTKAGKIEAIAVYYNSLDRTDSQFCLTVRPFAENAPVQDIISSEQLTIIGGKILCDIPCTDVTIVDFRQVLGHFVGHPLNELNRDGNTGYLLALPVSAHEFPACMKLSFYNSVVRTSE